MVSHFFLVSHSLPWAIWAIVYVVSEQSEWGVSRARWQHFFLSSVWPSDTSCLSYTSCLSCTSDTKKIFDYFFLFKCRLQSVCSSHQKSGFFWFCKLCFEHLRKNRHPIIPKKILILSFGLKKRLTNIS